MSIISYTTEYSNPVLYHGSDSALPCFVRPGRRMSAKSCLPLAFQGADGWSPPAGHMQEAEAQRCCPMARSLVDRQTFFAPCTRRLGRCSVVFVVTPCTKPSLVLAPGLSSPSERKAWGFNIVSSLRPASLFGKMHIVACQKATLKASWLAARIHDATT